MYVKLTTRVVVLYENEYPEMNCVNEHYYKTDIKDNAKTLLQLSTLCITVLF